MQFSNILNLAKGGGRMYPRIRDLREDKDLNQVDLADLLSVSQTTYSRYENGTLDIPSQSLIKLAKFHSTSIDYLLDLTDIKKPYPKSKLKRR